MSQQPLSTDPKDVEQIRTLMEDIDIAMVTTHDASADRLISRPLSTQVAEEDGDVLFLTTRGSSFVRDITVNPQVNVAYTSKKAWISLAGEARVLDDRGLVEQLWSAGAAAFMEGGPENPDNVVVRVHGETAELWGGKSVAGLAVSMVRGMIGNKDDDGTKVVDLG